MTNTQIAEICHETNRAYCMQLGDFSQPEWKAAEKWQCDSAIKGVEFHLANPQATDAASHESWLEQKRLDGWTYGPVKDPAKKQHPCFVPFKALPVEQQVKDALFKAVVDSLRRLTEVVPPFGSSGAPPLEPTKITGMGTPEIPVRVPLTPVDQEIIANKELRRDIDGQIQKVKGLPGSRERSITITKLQEAVMWLGMDLKRINDATGAAGNPYPNSKDPSNTKIESTADGLKL